MKGGGIGYIREDFYPTKTLFLRGPRIRLPLTLHNRVHIPIMGEEILERGFAPFNPP